MSDAISPQAPCHPADAFVEAMNCLYRIIDVAVKIRDAKLEHRERDEQDEREAERLLREELPDQAHAFFQILRSIASNSLPDAMKMRYEDEAREFHAAVYNAITHPGDWDRMADAARHRLSLFHDHWYAYLGKENPPANPNKPKGNAKALRIGRVPTDPDWAWTASSLLEQYTFSGRTDWQGLAAEIRKQQANGDPKKEQRLVTCINAQRVKQHFNNVRRRKS